MEDWIDWWASQLKTVSSPVSGLFTFKKKQVEFILSKDITVVSLPMPDGQSAKFDLDGFHQAATAQQKRQVRRLPSVITITADLVHERSLVARRLPLKNVKVMSRIELESKTPLNNSSVYFLYSVPHQNIKSSGYCVIKKDNFEAALIEIGKTGTKIKEVKSNGELSIYQADARFLNEVVNKKRKHNRWGLVLGVGSGLLIVGFIFTVVHAYLNYEKGMRMVATNLEQSKLEIDAMKADRLVKNKQNSAMRIVSDERLAHPLFVDVWEELTRALPDSAWLTDVSVSEGDLKFSGLARSASSLITVLSSAKYFDNPTFSGPVVLDPRSGKERFTIRARLTTK